MKNTLCFYHAGQSCGDAVADVWMRGRRGPKERSVCETCLEWLESKELADRYDATRAAASPLPCVTVEQLVDLGNVAAASPPPLPPHDACFYAANENMGSCEQHACFLVYMLGRSKKKYRRVCGTCHSWLTTSNLAVLSTEPIHGDKAHEGGVYH